MSPCTRTRRIAVGVVLLAGLRVAASCSQRTVAAGDAALADAVARTDGAAGAERGSPRPDLPPSAACKVFEEVAGPLELLPSGTRQALFSRDSKTLLVISAKTAFSGDLHQLTLPSGTPVLRGSGINSVEWLGEESALLAKRKLGTGESYQLVLLPFPSGPEQVLAEEVCRHLASPDGSRIYYVHHCEPQQRGTLVVLDPGTHGTVTLGDRVSMWDLTLSRDSQWLAFVGDMGKNPGCSFEGNLYVADAVGAHKQLVMEKATQGIAPLSAASFMAHRYTNCAVGSTVPMLVDAPTGTLAPMGCLSGFGLVSPDGSTILDRRDGKDLFTKKLYAVRPDCLGETLLAEDHYQYTTATAFLEPIFSRSGKRVLYLTRQPEPNVGLSVVPTAGGATTPLDTSNPQTYSFTASPLGEDVLLLKSLKTEIAVASLEPPTAKTTLFTTTAGRVLGSAALVRDGQILFVEKPHLPFDLDPTSMLHAARWGAGAVTVTRLAEWDAAKLPPYPMPFKVDPNGCVVVYNSDKPHLGTYLQRLP